MSSKKIIIRAPRVNGKFTSGDGRIDVIRLESVPRACSAIPREMESAEVFIFIYM